MNILDLNRTAIGEIQWTRDVYGSRVENFLQRVGTFR